MSSSNLEERLMRLEKRIEFLEIRLDIRQYPIARFLKALEDSCGGHGPLPGGS